MASFSGTASIAAELGKRLFSICNDVKGAEKETEEVANNVLLLSMVLEGLENMLQKDSHVCRPELVAAANSIRERCEQIFRDIEKAADVKRGFTTKKTLLKKLAWCFKKDRVKLLQASLESLKSTLSVLLHVVNLATEMQQCQSVDVDNAGAEALKKSKQERRLLTSLVIENRQWIERLEKLEADGVGRRARASRQDFLNEISSPGGTSENPFETPRQEKRPNEHREFVYAAANGDSHTMNDDRLRSNMSAPSSKQSRSKSNDADFGSLSDSDVPSAEELKMIKCLLYDPRTSQLVLSIVPHRNGLGSHRNAPDVSSLPGTNTAEITVDLLLENYTYLSQRNAQNIPFRNVSFQDMNPHTYTAGTYGGLGSVPAQPAEWTRKGLAAAASPGLATAGNPYAQPTDPTQGINGVSHGSTADGGPTMQYQGFPVYDKYDYNPFRDRARMDPIHPNAEVPAWGTLPGDVGENDPKVYQPPQRPKKPKGYGKDADSPRSEVLSVLESDSDQSVLNLKYDRTRSRSRRRYYRDERERRGAQREKTFRKAMVLADEVIQRAAFPRAEFYKLQEQHRILEQELRFEREKERIRQETLSSLKAEQAKQDESRAAIENSKPLTLKDCLGRSFSLPIQSCRSWQTMRSLITSSFLHIDALNPQITQGSYDLLGPSGDIILPEVWETMVQPGWVVELRIRPQSDTVRENLFPGQATPKSSPHAGSASEGRGSYHRHRPSLRGWLNRSKSSKENVNIGTV